MLYPSIDSLMKQIDSKYSLVSIAAKRARNLQGEQNYRLDKYISEKYVGKALEEIHAGQLMMKEREKDAVYSDE
ncbi:DNA-directed RNA polymerase subunit omega [Bacillus pakistanensis]|uniref:DNA-directed RNA polymerase subunit omega n=1 Tax=Rossellomorea pakistanensis TaxID=992288 RepID=A0ABS2NG11_9BACI|nr:DNA-directed RNA polymerase subunit omega [Bacillus pakistanensis]MBM7586779.1 DNA-directed RNA polymerase subunit omega [Bacillus pakistanensis]